MYAQNMSVQMNGEKLIVDINGYWITIWRDTKIASNVIFDRKPNYHNWLDKDHSTMIEAITRLEFLFRSPAID